MLNTMRLKIIDSQETPIVPGEVVAQEGMPLVKVLVNGKEHCRCGNSEKAPFMGFSYTESLTPAIKSKVEVLVADPDEAKVVIAATPVTGQIAVYDATENTLVADATVEGNVVTVPEALKGKEVKVVYRYAPSVQEVLMQDRVLVPSISASDMTGSIGVILQGVIYTNYFDASADFSDLSKELCVTEAGLVGVQAAGGELAKIPGTVIALPGVDNPFLGIRLVA